MPVKTGIQVLSLFQVQKLLDSGMRRNDENAGRPL